jgi:ribosomal peptide maturation radical SAM protein 1
VAALTAAQRDARADFAVALVAMPFSILRRPSIQVGLLSAVAESHGFPVTSVSAYLDLALLLGPEAYDDLAGRQDLQLGTWLFAPAAFPDDPTVRGAAYLDELGRARVEAAVAGGYDSLLELRDERLPAWLDSLIDQRDWGRFRVVGFTSSFQQHTACLALARRIKQRWPQVQIVFGGANFDGVMGPEWMRTMPVIDHAVSGEADRAFPSLLAALVDGDDPATIPGVLTRDGAGAVRPMCPPEPLEGLDDLPVPDFSEYFERATTLGLLRPGRAATVEIPYESSRGCWWGEKMTCRFCGLNGSTMRYRSKRPERVIEELAELARRHGSFQFFATDNILDLDHLGGLLDPLAEAQTSYRLFYEVKATFDRREMQRVHRGGIRAMQPGIESLSSPVLRLMRKGTRAADNVNLLRWARYFGIDVYWNLLWGFPGETVADYEEQRRLMRLIPHLEPPDEVGRISLERFSPYFEDPEAFPVRGERRPHAGLRHSFPAGVDLEQAAYNFDGELEGSLSDEAIQPLLDSWRVWRARWEQRPRPRLQFWWAPGSLRIEDARSALAQGSTWWHGDAADVYRAVSDRPATAAQAAEAAGVSASAAQGALDQLSDRGVAYRDGNLYLALATPGPGQR